MLKYINFINENKISYKKELCQDIWNDYILIERIENKLIKIAKDFFDDLELDTKIIDIQFTGSLANFNYGEQSDIDVHIIVDFSDINDNVELVKKAIDGQRFMWNLRHNIIIKEHPIEIYIQNISESHNSSGIYSLLKHEWIKKPTYNPPDIDNDDILPKYNSYVFEINQLEKLMKDETDLDELEKYYTRAKEIKKKLSEARVMGIKEKGEFSIENLVFKKLRNDGFVGKLIDVKNGLYDKMFAQ